MKNQNKVDKCLKMQNEDEILSLSDNDLPIQNKKFDDFVETIDDEIVDDCEDNSISHDLDVDNKSLVIDEKKVKEYWTKDTELAIVEFLYLNEFFYEARIKEEIDTAAEEKRVVNKFYCEEMKRKMEEVMLIPDRQAQREKIFKEKIETPLKRLIENILFNFKLFIPGIDAKTQQKDCFTFLYLKFVNFNPWQRTKSFSYFGTIAKHHFLGNKKDYSKNLKILYDYDSNKEEVNRSKTEEPKPYAKEEMSYDLFNFIIDSIDKELDKNTMSKNDQKVGDAIVQIFKNHELIGVYNKNQVYQLIKEITCLETKDITYSLHRFRVAYKVLKKEFMKRREI